MSNKPKQQILWTPVGTLAFPKISTPSNYNGKQVFGCNLIFKGGDEFSAFEGQVKAAANAHYGEDIYNRSSFKRPFREAIEKQQYNFPRAGEWFATINSNWKPKASIYENDTSTEIPNDDDSFDRISELFYPGAQCRACVNVYPFKGGKGVAMGLRIIEFVAHGDSLIDSEEGDGGYNAKADLDAAPSLKSRIEAKMGQQKVF